MQHLYKMDLLTEDESTLEALDFLILASGSDTRAYEVLDKYNKAGTTIKKVIVLNYSERLEDNLHQETLFSYKRFNGYDIAEITCSIKDPSSCLESLQLFNFLSSNKIGLDISYTTKPYLYFIIKLLKESFHIKSLLVFFTEPKTYIFSKGLFNNFKTSTGPVSITEIQGYSGIKNRGAKTLLVILLGFDGGLSKEINEDVSPFETIVVNGFPSYTPKFKDISLITNEKLVSDSKISVRYSRANNPFDTYNLLENILLKNSSKLFLNITPLGTKPMALGACLFALHNPDVRIIYPLPDLYENKYTDDSWSTWRYVLPISMNI
jgi:hypothetical protein